MKKGDVGMVKRFSKKYRNMEKAFNWVQFESYVKMPVSAWYYISTSLPQEQAPKTIMASMVRIQVLCTVKAGVANTSICLLIPHEAGKALQLL